MTNRRNRTKERSTRKERRQTTDGPPPPYEVPETLLEGLGPGLGYLASVIGGAFLLNLVVIVLIAGANGG